MVLMLVVMLVVVVADMEKVDFCLQADLWVLTGKTERKFLFSKNVHNFHNNCPQAMLAFLRLFTCLGGGGGGGGNSFGGDYGGLM